MKNKIFIIPHCLVVCMLFAIMAGCSSKHETSGEVIEKSTTTTVERPVTQEKRTTTTTTESR